MEFGNVQPEKTVEQEHTALVLAKLQLGDFYADKIEFSLST